MKIIDKINETNSFYSFEYYPPKTKTGQQNLYLKMEEMLKAEPLFVDITWGAGGSTSELTLEMATNMQKYLCIETQMHLTCTNMNKNKVIDALKIAKENGIQNILALRGDPAEMGYNSESDNNDLEYASDLVKFIRQEYGDYFGISVAGYPEGHPDAESYQKDLLYLKEKVDAGADFVITQFFFDENIFIKYVNDCRNIGITCPIVPGILPIFNFRNFKRMVNFTEVYVPEKILEDLEKIKNDDSAVAEYGTQLSIDLCQKLQKEGINYFHIYTLNRDDCTLKIVNQLDIERDNKILPWRPRANESMRPIFWANAKDNYIDITSEWDHFPNGRWGDSSKPSFGEINDYHLFTVNLGTKSNKLKMWGKEIKNLDDVSKVFIDFLNNEIKYIPWCDNQADETLKIKDQLIEINKKGLLTINSQPKLNAVSSNSKDGWGKSNGYIYQKAYLEFFIDKKKLDLLIKNFDSDISYCAVNLNDDMITNCDNQVNALTWGVFKNSEIIQPTIAEVESFKIWKKEAFNLWMSEWALIYPNDSESYNFINQIYQNYYLVYVVDNNYIDGDIFEQIINLI